MVGVRVLKIISKAVTASFRYPHIQIGKLPTYELPPPATIYGHLAAVLGDWFEPEDLEFAYIFEHRGKGSDVETSQPIEWGSGKHTLKSRGWDFPVNVVCESNPQRREFLLHPQLTLFLKGSEKLLARFQESFRNPFYAYILGRSQDLATCLDVGWVDLAESDQGFFSHTILPFSWRPWVSPGMTVQLPKAINYRRRRESALEVYLQVLWPPLKLYAGSEDTIGRDRLPERFWILPQEERSFSGQKLSRALFFHPVVGPGAV